MKNTSENSYVLLLVSFVVTALLFGTPALAQDKTAEIDKIFNWTKPNEPGCAVAVSQHGKLLVNRAYGSADLERDVPLSPGSILDAGSLRKQFVAASVLLLVEEGKLALSDDVRKHIPELPDYGHKITIDHLLTHTSGIRDWTGLLPLADGKTDVLTLILRQRGLNFAPGEEWFYSNSGYVLATEIVARTSGMSFSEFARKRLFEPLGMKTTRYVDDMKVVIKNRALAYAKSGNNWKWDMKLDNDRGGGALFTTAADLSLWNEALTSARLGGFVTEKLQEPATLNNGRKLSYARGLNVDTYRDGKRVWHSGAAAGYSSLLARFPDQGLSVAIMCNLDEGAQGAYASRILDLFLPPGAAGANARAANAAGADVTLGDLSGRAGLFFNEQNGQPLRLTVNNNTLTIAGGGPLVALASDRFHNQRASLFFMSQAEFEVQFLSADQFEIKTKEGAKTRYARAQPYTPTEADLQAFAGRYRSDEIGAFFDIAPGKDVLMGRANDAPGAALEFKPVDRDTFQLAGVILRFRRDKDGKVVAVDYSNPVVRNINFTRLGDRQ